MASPSIFVVCKYDGQVITSAQGPEYMGGSARIMRLEASTTYDELEAKVYKITKYDPRESRVKLSCIWPMFSGNALVEITDDASISSMIDFGLSSTQHSFELLVQKEQLEVSDAPPTDNFDGNAGDSSWRYGHMVNDDAVSAGGYDYTQHYSNLQAHGFFQSTAAVTCTPEEQQELPYTAFHRFPHTSASFQHDPSSAFQACPSTSFRSSHPEPSTLHRPQPSYIAPEPYVATGDIDMCGSDDDEIGEGDQGEDSVEYAAGLNEVAFFDGMVANNDFVELEDPGLDPLEDDGWVDLAVAEVNTAPYLDATAASEDCISVGDLFQEKGDLICKLKSWSIQQNVTFKTEESNKTYYTVVCTKSPECQWRLHACCSKRAKAWKVTKYNQEHTCINSIMSQDHRNCTSSYICSLIMPLIRTDVAMTPREIRLLVSGEHKIQISYVKAWDARRKALCKIFGDWESSYNSLVPFMEAMKASNPGTVYRLKTTETDVEGSVRFQRIFWCFGPCAAGFTHCRPVLCVDGTYLYGKYRGCMLIATGVDANNGIFPLGFAIVEGENTSSWSWFFRNLKNIPSVLHRTDLCIISDRHLGILAGMRSVFPTTPHRFCLRHFRQNFDRKFKNSDLHKLMYRAGETPDPNVHDIYMTKIGEMSQAAKAWLDEYPVRMWSQAHDDGCRYLLMTTNMSESFNGVLKGVRGLPIQGLIVRTFFRMNTYFVHRREKSLAMDTPLTAYYEDIFRKRERRAQYYRSERFDTAEFQVTGGNGNQYTVNFRDEGLSSCTCGLFQQQHLPCAHAIAAASSMHTSHYNFASNYYTVSNYQGAYDPKFHPIPDNRYWHYYTANRQTPTVLPPEKNIRPGRPKVRRDRMTMDADPQQRQSRCSLCKQPGHYRTRCPGYASGAGPSGS